jgi:GNAT superfamily N-acetyltransferase
MRADVAPVKQTLFWVGRVRAHELSLEDVADLQRFFEANPEYFLMVNGARPGASAARETFEATPPAGWSFSRKWVLGFTDDAGGWIAMADVVSDLLAAGVWHVGLFIVATSHHGTGVAQLLFNGLQDWAVRNGALWLRLGVVEGNATAERFWEKLGFIELRRREGIETGARINTLRVMARPLQGGEIGEYLELVPRDRPESPSLP